MKQIAAIQEKVEESESQARSLMSSLEMAKKKMEADDERVKDLTEQNRQLVESNDDKSGIIETVCLCSILLIIFYEAARASERPRVRSD